MKKLPLTKRFYMKWLSIAIAFALTLGNAANIWAYTVYTRVWPSASASYVKDPSFINYSAGFSVTGDNAAADWSATGQFAFLSNSTSGNHLQAQPIAGDMTSLAMTYPYYSALYRNQYNIVVNTGPGFAFYDGTQSSSLPSNYYDLRSLLRHEFGHVVGLGHSAAVGTLMYPTLAKGVSRTIDTDATNGASYLYNPNYAGPFPEGKGLEGSVGAGYWDSTHLNVGYKGANWTLNTAQPRAYNTSLSWTNSYHSSAWLAFNGSTITRVYTKHNLRGGTQVFIDGVLKATPNDYAALTRWQVAQTWSVTPGEHIIETRRELNDGKYSDLDAFFVNVPAVGVGSYDDNIVITPYNYIGTWTHSSCCATAYNGTISWSNTTSDAVTFTFTGTGLTYVFTKAYNRGIAYITIDGVDYAPLDLYAPQPNLWQQSQFYGGLSAGVHTIHIAVSGTKNPASADYYVDVDRFVVQ